MTSNKPIRGISAIDISHHADALTAYPLFAKPVAEGSSKGIQPYCKITQPSDLESTVSLLSMQYPGQDILIESYLAGREFTVGVLGTGSRARVIGVLEFRISWNSPKDGTVHTPNEIDFFTTDLKKSKVGIYVEELTPDMENDYEVQTACKRALETYVALGCRDYGRIDVRSDRKGPSAIPHIIEVSMMTAMIGTRSQLGSAGKNQIIPLTILGPGQSKTRTPS